ncbi:MFS transporter [Staphylococcus sp. IVB6238]|uniref:MFS transporter n=1 Tax=Staphylococcus sp. IVB6238 TaxID=2989770 RepID=UPI0021D148F2|nr:MFS transporter [Staphylococcus sp. IVB6238]UXR74186.1 MFS transporter [Staphylococcus sp. IVB6238]
MKKAIILVLFDIVSNFGSRVFSFACAFYILQYTDTSYTYSVYLALIVLCGISASPIIGVFTDSINNRRLVIIAQTATIGILAVFFFLFDIAGIQLIIITGMILTITDSVNMLILQSNLQTIVGEYLERIVSLRQTIITVVTFLSPMVGGVLIAMLSIQTLATLTLLTESIPLILLLLLPLKSYLEKGERASFTTNFKEGISYMKQQKIILLFICVGLSVNFFVNSVVVGVPIIAIQTLSLNSAQFGVIEGSLTISIFLTSLLFSVFPIQAHLFRNLKVAIALYSMILSGLGIFLFFETSSNIAFIFLIGVYVAIGFTMPYLNIPYSIYLQKTVDDAYKGRVFSMNQSIVQALMSISMLFYGLILNQYEGIIFLVTGMALLVVLLIFSIVSNRYENSAEA